MTAIRNKATGKYDVTFTTPSTFDDNLIIGLYYGKDIVETNAIVKVMLRLASIQDDTWVPYVPTNKELMSCKLNGYVGAKNLNSYPYTNTSYVSNGITWTDNGDGTVTANGTATADSYFGCHQRGVNTNNQLIIPNGTYIASGCPDTGSGTTYEIRIERTYNNAVDNLAFVRTMAGKVFTANGDDSFNDHVRLQINLVIRSGATVSNLTFKPMIRRVEDTDPTWQPYAKTNKELTEELTVETGEITRLVSFSALTSYGVRKYGKVVELYFAGTLSEAVNIWTDFLTVPDGFRPSHYVQIVSFNTYNSCKNLQLAPSGGIQSAYKLESGDFIRFTVTYIID